MEIETTILVSTRRWAPAHQRVERRDAKTTERARAAYKLETLFLNFEIPKHCFDSHAFVEVSDVGAAILQSVCKFDRGDVVLAELSIMNQFNFRILVQHAPGNE